MYSPVRHRRYRSSRVLGRRGGTQPREWSVRRRCRYRPLVGGGCSGKAACSYRWPLRAAGADAEEPGEALSVADDDDESLESQRQQEKAAAKERAAKKKQRIVTSGGGFKAKQGSSTRMG